MGHSHSLPISELISALAENLSEEDLIYTAALNDISGAIEKERARRGMTQAEFASLLGVTQAQVSKWENGDANFTLKRLSEIAAKLELKLSCSLTPRRAPKPHVVYSGSNNITYLPSHYQSRGAWTPCTSYPAYQDEQQRKEM